MLLGLGIPIGNENASLPNKRQIDDPITAPIGSDYPTRPE